MSNRIASSPSLRDGLPVLPGGRRRLVVTVLQRTAIVGLVAYAAHSVVGLGGRSLDGFFENGVFNALLLVGAILCVLRACWSPHERRAWGALALGLGCWTLGEAFFTIDPALVSNSTFPGVCDFLWVVFYPAAFVTLGLLVRARVRQFYASLWLDGLVGALAVAALATQYILPPIVAGTGGSMGTVVGDLIYPLGDLLLIAFVVGVLAITGWRPGRVLATVAVGILLSATADGLSLFWSATGHSGASAFDALWPASALVLGWAAWQPSRPAPFMALEGKRLLVFPVAFALTAVGLLGVQRIHPLVGTAYVLAVLTIAGVVARLGLIFTENLALVERSRREALTDVLTGLGNRRSLLLDLDETVWTASARSPKALLLFDLNGFKHYNDSFGHPVGDSLLARLGGKLADAIGPEGRAYRLGGDEFCVLTSVGKRSLEECVAASVQALSESDTGFDISTACGSIMLPAEADTTSLALQIVDERLYADKRSRNRTDAPEQCRDVLMQVLREREPNLYEHLSEVAFLAKSVGRVLGLSGEDLDITVRAAELHDLGKIAVPDAILNKPSDLDPGERAVVERHAEVGERILSVAPALRPVARLVRASHERFDGAGYPDRRSGRDIPIGARIIAVCDAFHAMTSDRPVSHGDRRTPGVERAAP